MYNYFEPEVKFLTMKELSIDKIFKHPELSFPFYLEPHRDEFYQKFMLHFKYETIGYKTLEEFRDHLQDIMIINHPKYLHYYNTQQQAKSLKWWNNKDYEFTQTRELVTSNEGTNNSKSSGDTTVDDKTVSEDSTDSLNIFSDTPEGSINDIDNYITTATKDTTDGLSTVTDKGKTHTEGVSWSQNLNKGGETEKITTLEGGNIGVTSSGDLVQSWLKDGLIDVDKLILNDCKILFMQVYD